MRPSQESPAERGTLRSEPAHSHRHRQLEPPRSAAAGIEVEHAVVCRHALPNARLSIVSVVGVQFGALLAGAIATETIFSWPGLGRLTVSILSNRKDALVEGCLFSIGLAYVLVNFLTDLVYQWIKPRMRGRSWRAGRCSFQIGGAPAAVPILDPSLFHRSDPEGGIFFIPRSPNARDRGHPPKAHKRLIRASRVGS